MYTPKGYQEFESPSLRNVAKAIRETPPQKRGRFVCKISRGKRAFLRELLHTKRKRPKAGVSLIACKTKLQGPCRQGKENCLRLRQNKVLAQPQTNLPPNHHSIQSCISQRISSQAQIKDYSQNFDGIFSFGTVLVNYFARLLVLVLLIMWLVRCPRVSDDSSFFLHLLNGLALGLSLLFFLLRCAI